MVQYRQGRADQCSEKLIRTLKIHLRKHRLDPRSLKPDGEGLSPESARIQTVLISPLHL